MAPLAATHTYRQTHTADITSNGDNFTIRIYTDHLTRPQTQPW